MTSPAFTVEVKNQPVLDALARAQHAALGSLRPALRAIAGTLETEREKNFEAEGRPAWQALAQATLDARAKRVNTTRSGKTKRGKLISASAGNFRILQDTGALAASFASGADDNQAWDGSNLVYAAVQHFGGDAGRGRKVKIPARPILAVEPDGSLPGHVERAVLDTITRHLARALT